MKDQQINTFGKGMMKDLGVTLPQEGSYVDAQNIRIISDGLGGENGSGIVIDVKGNKKVLDLTEINVLGTVYPEQYTDWVSTGSLTPSDLALGLGAGVNQSIIWEAGTYLYVELSMWFNASAGDIDLPIALIDESEETGGTSYILQDMMQNNLEIALYGEIDVLYYSSLDDLDNISDVKIIGHTTIRDTLVLFTIITLENSSVGPRSVILSCNLNDLTLSASLVYMEDLGFDPDYPIEAVARYESEDVQRVYWTDNLNTPKSINIVNPPSNLEALSMSLMANFSNIKVTGASGRGSLLAGSYQYCYRLSSDDGRITRFSSLSNFAHVLKGTEYWLYSEDPEANIEYSNTVPGEETDKALHITIEDIDPLFQYIEVAAIYSGAENAITNVTLLTKELISNSYSSVIIHKSTDEGSPISIEEITSFNTVPVKAKTIAEKDNRLFLGNVSYGDSSLEFNAQTTRYARTDAIKYPHTATEDVFTYESDQNPYNTSFQNQAEVDYKFRSDGVTLGGEGAHVSYEFIKKPLSGNNSGWSLPTETPMMQSNFESTAYCSSGDTNGDYKSPFIASNFKGYQRGEVYRFGIVLYDVQGNPGFVNWIGDIKFPSYEDFDHKAVGGIYNYTISQNPQSYSGTNYFLDDDDPDVYSNILLGGQVNSTNLLEDYTDEYDSVVSLFSFLDEADEYAGNTLYALGITFTVNIPEDIKNKISGYSIVRVERKEQDKSILGSGILNYLTSHYHSGTIHHYFDTDLEYKTGNGSAFDVFGDSIVTDAFGNNYNIENLLTHERVYNSIFTIDSPDFTFNNLYPSGECLYVKVIGALNGRTEYNTAVNVNHSAAVYTSHSLARQKSDLFETYPIAYSSKFSRGQRIPIEEIPNDASALIGMQGEYENLQGDNGFYNQSWYPGTSINASTYQQTGIGEDSLLAIITPVYPADSPFSNINWSKWIRTQITSDGTTVKSKLLTSVIRDLGNIQYGGVSESARAKNTYISTGHIVKVNDTSPQDIWGGDIYVTMYDLEKLRIPHESLDSNVNANKKSVNFGFPVESSVNTTLRGGYHFGNKTDWSSDENQLLNTFELNKTYFQENKTSVFIPKPLNFSDLKKQDSTIVYSNAKTNSETIDSYKRFKLENTKSVDGSFGSITKLIVHQDNMFFLQKRGFGSLSINPTSTVVDNDGASIVLGTGSVIQNFKYYSTTVGAQDTRSIVATTKGIYWVDKKTKKAYAFRANGLDSISDTHGMKSWFSFNIDKDSKVVLGNDVINDEVLFSIGDETLAFSEVLNKFTSFYTYGTPMYINTFDRLFSIDPNNLSDMYEHNIGESKTFYGEENDSYIEFLVNKHPIHTKVFDIIEWYTASNTNMFDSATFSNSNPSDTQGDDLSGAASKERTTRMPVPRTSAQYRFRDAYMKVRLTTSKEFTLHYVKTSFRISKR